MNDKISFLISVFNGLDYTKTCLDSLRQTVDLTPDEVIIVDDVSTDGTREYLTTLPAPFRVIFNEQKRSFAANNNHAVANATGEILCLLNNDVILKSGWLEPMLAGLKQLPQAGVIGNVQHSPRTGKYDHMGIVFGVNGVPWHFGKHFHFRFYRGCTEWKAVTAACCLVRRAVFCEVGGFDEAYINGSEDIDLCLRLGQCGYKHYVANESVVEHFVSSSEGRHLHNNTNEQRLLARWRSHIQQSLTPRDRRLFGINYILRFITQPWRYNGWKLWRALLSLGSNCH